MNKRKRSFSLLRPPASAQVGIPDDGVLVESGVEVKDDVWSFDEVNVESASEKTNFLRSLIDTHVGDLRSRDHFATPARCSASTAAHQWLLWLMFAIEFKETFIPYDLEYEYIWHQKKLEFKRNILFSHGKAALKVGGINAGAMSSNLLWTKQEDYGMKPAGECSRNWGGMKSKVWQTTAYDSNMTKTQR